MINPFQTSLFRFLVVGALSSLVNYGLFLLVYKVFSWHYILSYALGFISGFILGFILNKAWSFQLERTSFSQKIKYMSVYLSSLILGGLLLKFFVQTLGLAAVVGNIIVLFFTTCTNFVGVKFWAFKK